MPACPASPTAKAHGLGDNAGFVFPNRRKRMSKINRSSSLVPPRERPLPHPSWLRGRDDAAAARAVTPREFWSRLGE